MLFVYFVLLFILLMVVVWRIVNHFLLHFSLCWVWKSSCVFVGSASSVLPFPVNYSLLSSIGEPFSVCCRSLLHSLTDTESLYKMALNSYTIPACGSTVFYLSPLFSCFRAVLSPCCEVRLPLNFVCFEMSKGISVVPHDFLQLDFCASFFILRL